MRLLIFGLVRNTVAVLVTVSDVMDKPDSQGSENLGFHRREWGWLSTPTNKNLIRFFMLRFSFQIKVSQRDAKQLASMSVIFT